MNKLLLLLLSLTAFFVSNGQNTNIKGVIRDTSNNIPISLASVAVLNSGDSILQKSTRSDKNGYFDITNLKDGDYILLVTYPKYVDYVELFSIKNGKADNAPNIALTETAKILDEIVIQQPSILIKGDTTEYAADSFKVRENASVEELLKELPGIQVDKDGKIMAQGKQVQKVLVDGDEFFSDDPTVATRNLRADAVSKVQVFDKKSDQAAFTGIDDGQEVKAINLKLKESAKKGYFGKASVAGLDKYYNTTAMLNAFKSKRKLSVFGVASTTDQTGLSDDDQSALGMDGGGFRFGGMRGGSINIMSGSSMGGDGLSAGNSYGQGLPQSIKAGGHYDNKWDEGKYAAGADYLFNNLKVRSGGNTFSQNTLFDSVYYNRSASTSTSSRLQHKLSATTDIQLDSSSQIRITANGIKGTSDNNSENTSEALSEKMQTVNNSDRKTSTHADQQTFNSNGFYRKRFKKQGRTISINFSQRYSNNNSNGFLNDLSNFFDDNGNQIKQQLTDQNKINTTENNTLEGRLSYTNPLGKNSYLEINYSYNHNSNNQKRLSYNKDPDGKYSVLVDSLSSIFKYTYNTNSGGLNYRYNGKKFSFNAGGSLSNTAFEQDDKIEKTQRNYSYTNLFPRADFRFRFNSFSSLSFDYSGSTQQPTIDQLQPLKNNDDPLNIVVGNPDLKQSFSNNFGINYNSFEMLKEQYIFLGINFNTTANQINSSYTIDQLGRRVSQYINVNGNYSLNVYGHYSRKLGKTWRGSLSPNASVSKTSNFINGDPNVSNSFIINPTLSLSKRNVEKYEFSLDYNPSFNTSKSSISTVASQNYWIQNISFDGRYTLPWKVDLGTDISFEHRQKLSASDTKNQVIYWNAYLEKRLLKKEQLTVRFSMNDILDQNKGYERLIQPNAIVERNYMTFQRYGLITITYNFNTTGTGGGNGAPPPARRMFF